MINGGMVVLEGIFCYECKLAELHAGPPMTTLNSRARTSILFTIFLTKERLKTICKQDRNPVNKHNHIADERFLIEEQH